MSATIIRGNALDLPLADASVDLVVTSPPYWSLRAYTDNGQKYDGQLGSEATAGDFIDNLIAATAEFMRVLKPSGSAFVNLGDKYGPNKSLMLIPERYRIACIDRLGLIARAVVVWSKPNGLPESVTDRVRRSHEDWVHLTKEPRYYSAVDEIREPHIYALPQRRNGPGGRPLDAAGRPAADGSQHLDGNPLGKLPGSVWTIPTQPLKVPPELGIDHFAAFPMEFPRRIIAGWSPAGVCTACGQGRRPVATQTDEAYAAERARVRARRADQNTERESALYAAGRTNTEGFGLISNGVVKPSYAITGYACDCAEPTAPTTPGVVLDPFGGTGTTALVADVMGRRGISVDMSADYCRLAQWRTNDPKQRERAARGPKPAAKPKPPEKVAEVEFIHPDQLDLFEDGAA